MEHSPKSLDPRTLAKIKGLRLRTKQIVEGLLSGLHRSPFRGFSIEFSEHREYVPGDDLRHVDWKAVARTDKFYLKQFEDETSLICYLIVDASESMQFQGPGQKSGGLSKFEFAQCLAASLAWLVLQQHDSVGLATFSDQVGDVIPPSSQAAQLQNIIGVLESTKPDNPTQSGPVFRRLAERFSKRGIVFILSDMFDDLESALSGLQRLRYQRHQVVVLQTLDPAELEFPYDRSMLFRGLEGQGSHRADPRTIRTAYLEELSRFQRRLQSACQTSGIRHHLIRTDHAIDQVIGRLLTDR